MKPRFTTKCPANAYTAAHERIIEFSSDSGGGLISLVEVGGKLHVHVYRHDSTVVVSEGKRDH